MFINKIKIPHQLISNRISIFLLKNSKGFRENSDKDKFYNENKSRGDFLQDEVLIEMYRIELLSALKFPYQYYYENINQYNYKQEYINE